MYMVSISLSLRHSDEDDTAELVRELQKDQEREKRGAGETGKSLRSEREGGSYKAVEWIHTHI